MENDNKAHIKQPKTYEEQIQLLKKRGLVIEDEIFAKKYIKNNYYRFSAYTLILKKDNLFHKEAHVDIAQLGFSENWEGIYRSDKIIKTT